jgi:hypothetical protein
MTVFYALLGTIYYDSLEDSSQRWGIIILVILALLSAVVRGILTEGRSPHNDGPKKQTNPAHAGGE